MEKLHLIHTASPADRLITDLSRLINNERKNSVENKKKFFHLHLISDLVGETLISVGRPDSAQFQAYMPVEHLYPMISNQKQLAQVIGTIDQEPGIVLYTIFDQRLPRDLGSVCQCAGADYWNISDISRGAIPA